MPAVAKDPLGGLRREHATAIDALLACYEYLDDVHDGADDATLAQKEAGRLMTRIQPVLRRAGRIR